MNRRFAYPANIEIDESGYFLVTFPDVPEAGTDARTREDALTDAADALIAALAGYVNDRRDIPSPSPRRRGQTPVNLPPLVSAKLALYQAMREAGLTRVALAARLGVSEGAVRRLLDLDHRSHIGQVSSALAVLGKALVVEVRDAA